MNAQKCSNLAVHLTCTFLAALFGLPSMLNAQGPSLVDPNLRVRTVIENLAQPTSMAFLGPNDFFVLEKATGQVKRVVNGVVQSTVFDLAGNSGSERGLLGIALHPDFAGEPTPAAGRGNHDGGVIKFGPDGKLYIFIGDVGRRGWMQNLLN